MPEATPNDSRYMQVSLPCHDPVAVEFYEAFKSQDPVVHEGRHWRVSQVVTHRDTRDFHLREIV